MAAYNNGFPVTYPQMYYQPQPIQYQQPLQNMQPAPQPPAQQPNSGIIWVQGEAGAKSHLVAPNTTVALWDSEAQRIFLKSADAAGMPSMKILNYTIEETPHIVMPIQKAVNGSEKPSEADKGFIGRDAENALKRQLEGLKNDLESLRSEMDTFRGDLYGIAGKKTSGAAKKKEESHDD